MLMSLYFSSLAWLHLISNLLMGTGSLPWVPPQPLSLQAEQTHTLGTPASDPLLLDSSLSTPFLQYFRRHPASVEQKLVTTSAAVMPAPLLGKSNTEGMMSSTTRCFSLALIWIQSNAQLVLL